MNGCSFNSVLGFLGYIPRYVLCDYQSARSFQSHPLCTQNIMARIFITGSSDGLGALTAQRLISQGHQVVLHARNAKRAADAQKATPGALACLIGDLNSLSETKALAEAANALTDGGNFDAVLHNAALGMGATAPSAFQVNVVAPYVLTCLMQPPPKRLIYISSGLHRSGRPRLESLEQSGYNDTKLHDIMLAKAFARRWAQKGVESNAANPGWVPTKMGGPGAPGDITKSVDTFAMLALGEGAARGATGKYLQDSKVTDCADVADDVGLQDALLQKLADLSGVEVPE